MVLSNLDRSSHNILNRFTSRRIEGSALVDKLARAVCEAECLPRKEFFESWEAARRIRRVLSGGRIVELAAGHGLLSAMLLLLDGSSPSAVCIDRAKPASHDRVMAALQKAWPRLEGVITYEQRDLETTTLQEGDIIVSVHACGQLTDRVLDLAISARSPVAVLPCCQDLVRCDTGSLTGWIDGPLAVDVTRALRLRDAGYEVVTKTIPDDITPKNRLLIGRPVNF